MVRVGYAGSARFTVGVPPSATIACTSPRLSYSSIQLTSLQLFDRPPECSWVTKPRFIRKSHPPRRARPLSTQRVLIKRRYSQLASWDYPLSLTATPAGRCEARCGAVAAARATREQGRAGGRRPAFLMPKGNQLLVRQLDRTVYPTLLLYEGLVRGWRFEVCATPCRGSGGAVACPNTRWRAG